MKGLIVETVTRPKGRSTNKVLCSGCGHTSVFNARSWAGNGKAKCHWCGEWIPYLYTNAPQKDGNEKRGDEMVATVVETKEEPKIADYSELLKNSVILVFNIGRPGNNKRVSSSMVEVDADKDAISVRKELLDSKELKEIVTFDNGTRSWLRRRALPAYGTLGYGAYRIPITMLEDIDGEIEERRWARQALIESFLEVYDRQTENATDRLGALYDASDYPSVEMVRSLFYVETRYVALGTPDDLPLKMLKREKAKAAANLESEVELIREALRESFSGLISNATARLKVSNDGKKKVFRDSLVTNLQEFLDIFERRDLTNDTALNELVVKAKNVMSNVGNAQELRDNLGMRKTVRETFEQIGKTMADNVMVKKSRKISFED